MKLSINWFTDKQISSVAEKEYPKKELISFQSQFTSYFFLNILNHIHALIDINKQDAQLAVVKLSEMLGYLIFESNHANTSLQREIEFLGSYIDLMKLSVNEKARIEVINPSFDLNFKIPPLLIIPFIENAFKHGVTDQENSYINVKLEHVDHSLLFSCTNSLVTKKVESSDSSGVGLRHVKKRLDLIYGSNYHLLINESYTEFQVKLKVPMQQE